LLTWSVGGNEDDGDVDVGLCVFCLRFSFCFPCLSVWVSSFASGFVRGPRFLRWSNEDDGEMLVLFYIFFFSGFLPLFPPRIILVFFLVPWFVPFSSSSLCLFLFSSLSLYTLCLSPYFSFFSPSLVCIPSLAFIVRECHAFSLDMKTFRTVIAGVMMAGASVSLVWWAEEDEWFNLKRSSMLMAICVLVLEVLKVL